MLQVNDFYAIFSYLCAVYLYNAVDTQDMERTTKPEEQTPLLGKRMPEPEDHVNVSELGNPVTKPDKQIKPGYQLHAHEDEHHEPETEAQVPEGGDQVPERVPNTHCTSNLVLVSTDPVPVPNCVSNNTETACLFANTPQKRSEVVFLILIQVFIDNNCVT